MIGEEVTRRRREVVGEDRYGDAVYEDVEDVLAERAAFDPGGSIETPQAGRNPVTTKPKLYFRNQWPDLTRDDRVVVRGVEFLVDGDPADWRSPHGSGRGGLVVELTRTGG